MATFKLTNSFCNTAQYTGKHNQTIYFDCEITGFILEVRKSLGKTFYLRYQRNNKTVQHKIGNAAAMTATQARKEAKRVRSAIDLGNDIYADKQILNNTPTLLEFYTEYYLPHIKQQKRSWRTDESVFRNHILPLWGDILVCNITRHMITIAHNNQLSNGLKPATANKFVVLLRSAINLAIRWDIPGITVNPASNFKLSEENNKVKRYLNKDEAAKLITAAGRSKNKMLVYIVKFLLLTGARRNEALHAKWEHFDFNAMSWRIPLSKSGKSHHVPITGDLHNLLRSIPRTEKCLYVFPTNKGTPYTNIYSAWNAARNKAGLADVRMHDLRHTFASTLVNSGRSLYEVMSLLGHHNVSVTQRYAHLSNEILLEAADCAASILPHQATNVIADNSTIYI